jgi:hypothetical protein
MNKKKESHESVLALGEDAFVSAASEEWFMNGEEEYV